MNRADFGHWGADLDADTFAKALAAAGVLGATGQLLTPNSPPGHIVFLLTAAQRLVKPGEALSWHLPPLSALPDADMLAALWNDASGAAGRPLRLTIEGLEPEDNPTWLAETLGRDAVGLASVVVAPWTPANPVAQEAWHWPVDIGFLPDAPSRALSTAIGRELAIDDVIERREVGADRETCDLLLLPYTLRDAVIHVLQTPVRASCVVVLGTADEPWERMRPMLETLLAHARASAIVIAPVPENRRTEWVGALVQELAQDAGLDVALHRAAPGLPPLIIAPERMLRRTRMGPVLRELEQMAGSAPPEVGAEIEAEVSDAIAAGDVPDPLFRGLAPANGGPTAFSPPPRAARRAAEATRTARAAAPKREPRYVHAEVALSGEPGHRTTLEPATTYDLRVHVGPLERDRLHADRPVDEKGLFQHGEASHRLRVFITDLRGGQEPLSGEIRLPRTGRSSQATFPLPTGETGDPVEYRVIIAHRNRVLQTLKLRAVVGEPGSLSLKEEIVARAALDDLDARSRFDLALIVNRTDAGKRAVTGIAGQRVGIWWKESYEGHITALRNELEEIIDQISEDPGFPSEPMRQFLVSMAWHGAPLGKNLRDMLGDAWFGQAAPQRIQVVSADIEGYLPLELVYDLPVPNKDAKICRPAKNALKRGHCTACRSRKPAEQQKYVCPLGFWALSKVIERQAFDRDAAREVRDADGNYLLVAEPTRERPSIGTLDRIVFAASSLADGENDTTVATTAKTLQRWAPAHFRQAADWAEWVDAVEKVEPDLLVLLPHTDMDDDGDPTLEVGDAQALYLAQIGEHHVTTDRARKPMVLLLGCATSSPDYPLLKLPTVFRQGGAGIVLTTLTSVLGRQAGPVAQMLVDAFHTLPAGTTRTFGELALETRRQAMLQGNLMGLVMAAYGDADWQFGA